MKLIKCFPFFSIFFLSVCGVLLSACGTLYGDEGVFRGKSKDYLETAAVKPIEVPEGMTTRSLEPIYGIPDVRPKDEFGDYVSLKEYEVPRPDAINTEKGNVGVKLQKLGDRKWIFLNASTSQVWPRTQNFLSEYGLRVARSNPNIGLIETADVIFKDSPELKSRFRIFIEKGVHPETTEVHIVQVEFPLNDTVAEDYSWPESSQNVERERILLDELANVLAQNVSNNAASLLGQNVGGELKVEFLKNESEPTMRLRLFEERAKATVAHALGREGFYLWEESTNGQLYYVAYNAKYDGDPGMWDRLLGRTIDKKPRYTMEKVLQHLAPQEEVKQKFSSIDGVDYGKALPKAKGLLVLIDPAEKGVDVLVRDARGRKLPPQEAKNLLRIIRKNLI